MRQFLEARSGGFIQKKRGSGNPEPREASEGGFGSVAVLFLIAGIAVESSGGSACGRAKQGTTSGIAGLMANEGSGTRAEQAAGGGTALGIRAGGGGTIREAESEGGGGERQDNCFHWIFKLPKHYPGAGEVQDIFLEGQELLWRAL